MSVEQEVQVEMRSTIEHLHKELKGLRTSRANIMILDGVYVEVYGAKMRLQDIANVTVSEPRQIVVTPYDSSNIHAIAKAIEQANLGILPAVDSNVVRINIPPMDEMTRKKIAKQCKQKAEESKISIREVRRKYNDQVRAEKASGDLSEDLMKKAEKKIQEMTDKYCKDIEELCSKKEQEILEI